MLSGLDYALFKYNVLFKNDINTPNEPSDEKDGIAYLGGYSLYANPLWRDNIPPKDGNLFLEDGSTLKGKECVVLETTSSTLCGFSEDTIVEVELSATFLYSLFTCDDMYANVESRPCGYGKDYGKQVCCLDPCLWPLFLIDPGAILGWGRFTLGLGLFLFCAYHCQVLGEFFDGFIMFNTKDSWLYVKYELPWYVEIYFG